MLPFFVKVNGAIAKRLCTGLQIRLAQFDSGSRLQTSFWNIHASAVATSGAFLFAAFVTLIRLGSPIMTWMRPWPL